MSVEIAATSNFLDAAQQWIDSRTFNGLNVAKRTQYVSARTLKDYRQYIDALGRFFGSLRLEDIHLGHIRQYQVSRSSTAGANKINQESGTLRIILRAAGCWTDQLEDGFEPLQHEETDIPRALTPIEQHHFLAVTSSRDDWKVAYWYSLGSLHTTCSNCEMTGLKVGDITLHDRYIMVRKVHAKNKYRMRTIPLTEEAHWAFSMILERAQSLGSVSPQHFIFPFRVVRNEFDPTRPMTNSGIKKPFDEARREAGLPHLRMHDLRHTAITRLAESGTPIPVIMSMAGHISQRMMQHYTQISEQSKRNALRNTYGNGGPRQPPPPTGNFPSRQSRQELELASRPRSENIVRMRPRPTNSVAFVPAWKNA